MKFKSQINDFTNVALLGLFLFASSFLPPASGYGAGDPELLWEKRYDSGGDDVANGVAVDKNNNIIVTGKSNNDYYTIKYDSAGKQLWDKLYNSSFIDQALAVATDSNNNIIVTGEAGVVVGNTNFITIKYDAQGNQLWMKSIGAGSSDLAYGIAVDSNNNIVVTGQGFGYHTATGWNSDFLTVKYDNNGGYLWYKTYDNYYEGARAVAIDSKDNVVVTGYSGEDFYTIKYDANGNELWGKAFDNTGSEDSDKAFSVVVDSLDNIIVAGSSDIYDRLNNKHYYYTVLIKYDSNGRELWKREYESPSGTNTVSMTINSSNEIIVARSGLYSSSNDYYIASYSSDGNVLWEKIYDGGSTDMASKVAVDLQGNVIVTGSSRATQFGNSDYLTLKYGEPIIVPPSNNPPVLDPIGDKQTNEGQPLSFTVSATDQNNDLLTYSASPLPVGATFTNQTFSWTPGYDQQGSYETTFSVTDNKSPPVSQTITITAQDVNRPPVLDHIPDYSISEGQLLTFTISATDPDPDSLAYSVSNPPQGASFSSQTFSWTPNHSQAGTYWPTFSVTDNKSTPISQTITISVSDVVIYQCSDNLDNDSDGKIDLDDPGCASATDNDETDPLPVDNPPTACIANPGQSVQAGSLITLDGSCSFDPEGDTLSYQWTQTKGSSVNLLNPSSATASFVAPEPKLSQSLAKSLALSVRMALEILGLVSAEETSETLEFQLTVSAQTKSDTEPAQVIVTAQPLQTHTLTLTKSGSGQGSITSQPSGLTCDSSCNQASSLFEQNTSVKLTALANPDSNFLGFSGSCFGETCQLTMDSDKSITASFDKKPVNPSFVSISSPLEGSIIKPRSQVKITTGVSSSDPVARVEFYVNGAKKHTDRNYPYSYNWRAPKTSPASYQLQAKLYIKDTLLKAQILADESEVVNVKAE